MATLTAGGIGSGLDIGTLVSQLVAAERSPVSSRLDRQEAQVQAKISSFGTLRSALAQFQGALKKLTKIDDFLVRRATSGDDKVFTVAATSVAAGGSYGIQVERLAQAHKLLSGGFTGPDEVVGTGTLTVAVGGASVTLTVDGTHNTLAGVRDAINDATGNPGVVATILNVFDEVAGANVSKLVLTGTETGAENAVTLSVADADTTELNPDGDTDAEGLSRLASNNLSVQRTAQDALLWLDGQKVVSPTNTVDGAIEGVTLTLKAASGRDDLGALVSTTLEVAVDQGAAKNLVQGFVSAYNAVVDALKAVDSYNASTRQASPLFGESAVRGVSTALRRVLSDPVGGLEQGLSRLADLGVTAATDGKLTVDARRLDAVLSGDLEGVGQIFAGEHGLASRLDDRVSAFLDAGGVLKSRTDGLDGRVKDINKQREALARRIEALESRLLKQFTAMDELVAQLQSTGNFLTQQLSSLQLSLNSRNGG